MKLLTFPADFGLLVVVFLAMLSGSACAGLEKQSNMGRQTAVIPQVQSIPINRQWDVLSYRGNFRVSDGRELFARSGELLADWVIEFAGIDITGNLLVELSRTPKGEPLVRATREKLKRPIDLEDFLFFIDDVLHAGNLGLRGGKVFLTSGRARSAGILLHPDDIFRNKPRRYGRTESIRIDEPPEPEDLDPAIDGEPLGPNWTARFRNPFEEEEIIATLAEVKPDFASRIKYLLSQLRQQGAEVYYASGLRYRERGYLMYGAFTLASSKSESELSDRVKHLERLNREWKLNIPIQWRHPKGWSETLEAAKMMRDTYGVVYATESGARRSNHYGGKAIDFTVVDMPRTVVIKAPNGKTRTFDLSSPEEARDLSLTPELIQWVEKNFHFRKLVTDYPHWTDSKK